MFNFRKPYEGKRTEDIHEFRLRFDAAAAGYAWEDGVAVVHLMQMLAGEAKDSYVRWARQGKLQDATVADAFGLLTRAFANPYGAEQEAHRKFVNLTLKPGQSVQAFYNEFCEAATRARIIDHGVLTRRWVSALPADMQPGVMLNVDLMTENPAVSMQQLLQMTTMMETFRGAPLAQTATQPDTRSVSWGGNAPQSTPPASAEATYRPQPTRTIRAITDNTADKPAEATPQDGEDAMEARINAILQRNLAQAIETMTRSRDNMEGARRTNYDDNNTRRIPVPEGQRPRRRQDGAHVRTRPHTAVRPAPLAIPRRPQQRITRDREQLVAAGRHTRPLTLAGTERQPRTLTLAACAEQHLLALRHARPHVVGLLTAVHMRPHRPLTESLPRADDGDGEEGRRTLWGVPAARQTTHAEHGARGRAG